MKYTKIPENWIKYLINQPETGMGYQNTIIKLSDGQEFKNVVIVQDSLIVSIEGYEEIPFDVNDIVSIKVVSAL